MALSFYTDLYYNRTVYSSLSFKFELQKYSRFAIFVTEVIFISIRLAVFMKIYV